MKIGELAKITGCTVQSIRFYEKEGLLECSARSQGNYRIFNEATIERINFIIRCRSIDLSLAEIRELLSLSRSPERECERVNFIISEHIGEVESRIRSLKKLKQQLQGLQSSCSKGRIVGHCGILQSLAGI